MWIQAGVPIKVNEFRSKSQARVALRFCSGGVMTGAVTLTDTGGWPAIVRTSGRRATADAE